jgi:hypothetical protein
MWSSISDYESIRLARELGLINPTDAVRLGQHLELLAHFDSLDNKDAENEEMTRDEAISFLRTCVNSVLGREGNIAPVEFISFRSQLEGRTFKEDDTEILTLQQASYFFKKTTISILLAGIKSKSGAQFEHTIGNIGVIVPALWTSLREAEKWSIGQTYAEVVAAGAATAVAALKKALTKVHGFDFVPESLRSQTFAAAAANVIKLHTGTNNFYNEPLAIAALSRLGTTIPWPAFPICVSATLAVVLGNAYGTSFGAQSDADSILSRLSQNQWEYYLNECLSGDELVLQKLSWNDKPLQRWFHVVHRYALLERNIKKHKVRRLIETSDKEQGAHAKRVAEELLSGIGK